MQPEVHLLVQSQVHLFRHLYIDLEVQLQVQIELYYQVHPTLYLQAHLKRITRCTKKFILSFIFNWPVLHSFAPLIPFLRIFSSVFNIRSDLQSHLHLLGELSLALLCRFKQIIDCTFKCTMIYANIWIIYSAGIALYACVKYRINSILKLYKFPIF